MTKFKSGWICKNTIDVDKKNITSNMYKWLVMSKNITETIKKTGLVFSLNLVKESFESPNIDEKYALNDYDDTSHSFVRKVFLEGNSKPMVFARVVIPKKTYLNYKSKFTELGNKPIGNTILYSDSNVIRKEFEYKLLKDGDELLDEIKSLTNVNQENLWARRSVFVMPKGYVLITEVFLNEIPTYPY